MTAARTVLMAGVLLVMALGSATSVSAAEVHPFVKLGFVANGEYSEPLGFADRFLYRGGLDLGLNDVFSIGPEFQYQHRSYGGTVDDVEYAASENVYTFYANGCVTPQVEWEATPFFGAGLGFAHGSSSGTVGENTYAGLDGTKSAFHAFGGISYGHLTIDFDVSHVFWTDSTTDAVLNFGVRF